MCAASHCGEMRTNRSNTQGEVGSLPTWPLICSWLLSDSWCVSALGWPHPQLKRWGSSRWPLFYKWEDASKGKVANAFRPPKGPLDISALNLWPWPWFLPFSCCGSLWQSGEASAVASQNNIFESGNQLLKYNYHCFLKWCSIVIYFFNTVNNKIKQWPNNQPNFKDVMVISVIEF